MQNLHSNQSRLTKDVENEADETMMCGKRQQHLVNQDNVLKVVDDAFTVEKIHGGSQPIPIEALGRSERSRPARNVGNGNDFFERNDLDHGDNDDDVNVAHEEGGKEGS